MHTPSPRPNETARVEVELLHHGRTLPKCASAGADILHEDRAVVRANVGSVDTPSTVEACTSGSPTDGSRKVPASSHWRSAPFPRGGTSLLAPATDVGTVATATARP